MTIRQSRPPEGGRQAISAALSRRLPRAAALSPLGGSPATGAALPMYNIELDQTGLPDPLEAATLVGWRYPVVGGPEAGLAHLGTEGTDNEYQGLTRGYLPQRLVEAASIADEAVGGSSNDYEARLLQIPALRIVSLWMAGENDNRFVILTDGRARDIEAAPPLVDDIRPVIEAARRQPSPGERPAGAGPSNAD